MTQNRPRNPKRRSSNGTSFGGFLRNDIGIDLGTANTLVYVRDRGIVLAEPSVVAINKNNRKVRAVGEEAKKMLGRTPGNIAAIRPMKDGVIADLNVTEEMLRYFINKVHRGAKVVGPRMMIAVPSGITEVERRAVEESAITAGARKVKTISEPMAAAIGVGLPIEEPTANMVLDIGGGTSEVAIISLGGLVYTKSIRTGGDKLDEDIIKYVRRNYNLVIGPPMAEEIKMKIGSAVPLEKELEMEIKGRDYSGGLPKSVHIKSEEVREAVTETLNEIANLVTEALENCPEELSADLVDRGFVMSGGGALIRKLDALLAEKTGLPVIVAEDPLGAVARGTGAVLGSPESWIDNP